MKPLGAKKNWGQEWASEKYDSMCLKLQGRSRAKRNAEKEIKEELDKRYDMLNKRGNL